MRPTDPFPPPSASSSLPGAARWLRPSWYVLSLGAFGAILFWAQRMLSEYSTDEQRALVPHSTVWGMHACLFLGLLGLAGIIVPLARLLGRRRLFTGLALAVLGYAACGLAPRTTRIFYDEHIYMQIGQTLAHTGRAEYASYARAEYGEFEVYQAWVNKQPNGHPYLLSWAYRLFGASEQTSNLSIRALVGLAAALLYFALAVAPLSLPSAAPLAVALCYIFTPLIPWWGQTVAVEPSASATAIAGFFAACLHARWRNPDTGEGHPLTAMMLAAAAAFAAYFRPESLLIFPVVAGVLWAADRRFLEDRITWAAVALAIALLTPNLLHLWSVRTEDWGATDGRRFDFAFLRQNFASNAGYFIQGKWFPLAGTVLALVGALWLGVRNRWLGVAAGVWFALSWGIFVLFYAGGYHYGASSRYAVVSAAPIALFMGVGAAALLARFRAQPLALGAIGLLVVASWLSAWRFVPTLGRESNQARADVEFAQETAAKLPTGALIISPDPCIWNMLGRNAAQLHSVEPMLRSELGEMVRQYPGGIYLHWDYWVNSETRFSQVWRQLVVDTHATLFARQNAEAVKLGLFRLDTPYALKLYGGHYKADPARIDLDSVLAETQAAEAPAIPAAPPTDADRPATGP